MPAPVRQLPRARQRLTPRSGITSINQKPSRKLATRETTELNPNYVRRLSRELIRSNQLAVTIITTYSRIRDGGI